MKFPVTSLLPILPIVAAAAGCSQNKSNSDEQKPLNIIYIMTDDHSYQTMSCYDNRYIKTPNMDRLAAEGVLFQNSFVANSLSGPSRACLLTGKHSHANGFTNNRSVFDGSQQTFIKLLTGAGYQTAVIGKWHLVSKPTGFTHWEILNGQGPYYNPDFLSENDTTRVEGYVTDIVTDKGMEWISQRDKDKPFCLLLHHKAVHRSWYASPENINEFEDKTFPIPDTYWDDYATRPAAKANKMSIINDMDLAYDLKMRDPEIPTRFGGNGELYRMTQAQKDTWNATYGPLTEQFKAAKLEGKELAEWKFQRYMKDYLKCVKSVDDNIGRLLDYLKQEGLLENTLVVYASDQGFYMGEHGWFDKRFMYEESFKTPLIARLPDSWKKAKRGARIEEMVQNIDYAPTFLDLAGVEIPSDIQGVSLLPLLKGEHPKDWRNELYYHYYEYPDEHNVHPHYGVRDERYKLIYFYDGMDSWELFDLQSDPDEMKNVYDAPEYAKVREQMHAKLDKVRERYQDTNSVQ